MRVFFILMVGYKNNGFAARRRFMLFVWFPTFRKMASPTMTQECLGVVGDHPQPIPDYF